MIISEGTFNCFLSTLSGVAKTPSEDCQLSQIYSSDGRDQCHCWDGKVFNPSKYPYRHLHIQRITSWPDWCWGPPGLSVAARSVPACCVLSELTCCCSDGTHLASSGRPSCGHQSTGSAASPGLRSLLQPPLVTSSPPATCCCLSLSPCLQASCQCTEARWSPLLVAGCVWVLVSPVCLLLCLLLN